MQRLLVSIHMRRGQPHDHSTGQPQAGTQVHYVWFDVRLLYGTNYNNDHRMFSNIVECILTANRNVAHCMGLLSHRCSDRNRRQHFGLRRCSYPFPSQRHLCAKNPSRGSPTLWLAQNIIQGLPCPLCFDCSNVGNGHNSNRTVLLHP